MIKINLAKNLRKGVRYVPVVAYTHCLLTRPVRVVHYSRLRCNSEALANFFAKVMAMVHDYFLCTSQDYGIRYGIYYEKKAKE